MWAGALVFSSTGIGPCLPSFFRLLPVLAHSRWRRPNLPRACTTTPSAHRIPSAVDRACTCPGRLWCAAAALLYRC
jgi:hypothetical protein